MKGKINSKIEQKMQQKIKLFRRGKHVGFVKQNYHKLLGEIDAYFWERINLPYMITERRISP